MAYISPFLQKQCYTIYHCQNLQKQRYTIYLPFNKQGLHIDKAKYEAVKAAIIVTLAEQGDLTFKELNAALISR